MPLALISKISPDTLTSLFSELKSLYKVNDLDSARKDYITSQVRKYGYLPYSHIKALEELSPAEVIVGLEEKLGLNKTYIENAFVFNDDTISAVNRAGFSNSSWIKTEQHNLKLVNLAALGNGNKSSNVGRFIDWLIQLLILPSGNIEKGILGTTIYLIPFHPRDFGCAYLPTSSAVSPNLEDENLKKLGYSVKEQVRLFILLAQLSGHPIMYDVLPQTGRFSKTILSNPHVARWFDVKELISKINNDLLDIAEELKQEYKSDEVDYIREIISNTLSGNYQNIRDEHLALAGKIKEKLDEKRKVYSNEMLLKENQELINARAKKIINNILGKSENDKISEDDIPDSGGIIGELISKGLWPAPGGAWNSCGIPIFDKMSQGAGYPMFKHFDYKGNDVTEYANLDCQTPYYFVYLENGEFNEKVIDFYVDFLKKIQSDYNFDGFRVDHIDHIVDAFSETKSGQPISYRAPRYVLGKANRELKKAVPHFAALAEYMLWENFFKEYHQDMDFDVLWGCDIISQYLKNVAKIIEDNEELEEYNSTLAKGAPRLSILKTYNNQDGEFRAIDQYPGQLSEAGALFKWFKFKFLPGGKLAQRPVLYIDGDESFTKTGTEKVIGAEISMERVNNKEFYRKFEAISRFALNNDILRSGKAELISANDNGFVSWIVKSEDSNESLFITANETPPTETFRQNNEDGSVEVVNKVGEAVNNINVSVPNGCKVLSEYVLQDNSSDFEEISVNNISALSYNKLEPSEFHIYKIQ